MMEKDQSQVVEVKRIWEQRYNEQFSKINSAYIQWRIDKTDLSDFIPNYRKESVGEYADNTKYWFLQHISDGLEYEAFQRLQKRLPILSEHLILQSFKYDWLSKKIFSKAYRRIYTYAEKGKTLFSNEINYSLGLDMFEYCNKRDLMTKEDRVSFAALAEYVIIYRGVSGSNLSQAINGISWTLDKEQAVKFGEFDADLYGSDGYLLLKGRTKKSNILAYLHDSERFEHEVIIKPTNLIDLEHTHVKSIKT